MLITLSTINQLLIEEDVEGLIEAGAPVDEYEDEAAQIAAAIALLERDEISEEIILSTLGLVWLGSFELSYDDIQLRVDALKRLAKKIWAEEK